MTAITGKFKVIETIGGRVGRYNFSPTLILFGSKRKQCPLYSANPHGQTESSLLGCERSACRRLGWSLRMFQTQQHEPHGSTRVVEGQPDGRGRATRQSLFIARDRLRCEPGSKPVIVTAPFTGCEGHVPSRGDKGRRWKIFVGCPAFLSFWDQSPGRNASRSETVGNRLYRIHGQISLCRFAAEAQIQDRSRSKTGPNTAPGFLRVKYPFREAQTPDDGARKPKRPQTDRGGCPPSSPLPRWERARARVKGDKSHFAHPAHSPVIPAQAGTQRKTKHAIYHPVIPAQPAPYPDTGASAGGTPILRGGANRHPSSIWPCDNSNIELCKGP